MRQLQTETAEWMTRALGPGIRDDKRERVLRFLEEALELCQVCELPIEAIHNMIDYTYNRPVGEIKDEVGGVLICLAALCNANDVDMQTAVSVRMRLCYQNMEAIRLKHMAKPRSVRHV